MEGGVGEGGLRQETQGCWHVLFFHYVISIPMRSALIFDEPSAQHPPLSPSHPIPAHPILSLSPFPSLTGFFSPTYVSSLSYMLHFFFLLLWSICLASWNLGIFVKVAESGRGIWDELLFFSFHICYWRLSKDFNLNQTDCTLCRLSNKSHCVFFIAQNLFALGYMSSGKSTCQCCLVVLVLGM